MNEAVKRGSKSILLTIAFIAVVVLINYGVGQISPRYTNIDVSEKKLYTIGDETLSVLSELQKDVDIFFLTEDSQEDTTITMLLENYAANSPHIKVEKIDINKFPGFAAQYTTKSLGVNSVIVACGDRSRGLDYSTNLYVSQLNNVTYEYNKTGFDGEGQVTSAISYVTGEDTPVIYSIQGHNEATMDPALLAEIEKLNFKVEEITLLTVDEIPADAAGIILFAPLLDLSPDDVKKIESYLDKGGDGIIFTNYSDNNMKNLSSLLEYYNMRLIQGLIVEGDMEHFTGQNPMYLIPDLSETSNLTAKVRERGGLAFSPLSEGIKVISEDSNTKVEAVLSSSSTSYAKENVSEIKSYAKAEGDEEGPFMVGAISYKAVNDGQEQMRLGVFTSVSFALSSADETVSGSNYSILTNMISWITNVKEESRIPSKNVDVNFLTIRASQITRLSVILIVIIPAAVMIAGISIWYTRRKK